MKIDLSIYGLVKSIGYLVVGAYTCVGETGINAHVLFVLFFFMLLDMILGVIKAITVPALDNPISRKAKKGILTKIIMFILPIVSGLMWSTIDKDSAIYIVNLQLTALMVAEAYSNVGNAYTIYTGEVLTEFDAITFVFRKSAEKIKSVLEKIME